LFQEKSGPSRLTLPRRFGLGQTTAGTEYLDGIDRIDGMKEEGNKKGRREEEGKKKETRREEEGNE
jgi:hypothetical protein